MRINIKLLVISIFINFLGVSINAQEDSRIQQVFAYIDNTNWQEAESLVKQINNKTLTRIVLSQKFLDQECSSNSFEEVIKFLNNNPKWPQNKLLQVKAEKYLNYNSDKKIIVNWFNKHHPVTGIGYKFYAFAASSLIKDSKILLPIIKQAWIYGDFTSLEEKEYYNKWHKCLSIKDHIQKIDEHLWKSDIKSAINSLKYVDVRYQNSFKTQIALIKGDANAHELFKAIPEKYYTPGLLYRYLDATKTVKPTRYNINLFQKVRNYHKHSAKWCRLQLYYAREFIDYKDFANSYRIISIPLAINNDAIREQEWLAGWLALRFLDKPNVAVKHFNKFLQLAKTPISLSSGSYWLGRSYQAIGNKDLANKFYVKAARYPYTFYGQAASIEIKKKILVFPSKPVVTLQDKTNIEKEDVIKALKLFIKYKKSRFAVLYAHTAIEQAKTSGEKKLIADIIKSTNNLYHTVYIAKIAAQYNALIMDQAFPTPYKILDLPIDPALIYSIIRKETIFNHTAVSKSKAMGLMQLRAEAACDTAKSINVKYEIKKLTKDPLYNIKLGAHYLKQLLQNHSGSYVLAITAYNAGSGKVVKWIERFGDPRNIKDMWKIIDWIELIPYEETRNYVQRVLECIQIYRSILIKNCPLQFKQDLHGYEMKG